MVTLTRRLSKLLLAGQAMQLGKREDPSTLVRKED
jgi:hypothetical protein